MYRFLPVSNFAAGPTYSEHRSWLRPRKNPAPSGGAGRDDLFVVSATRGSYDRSLDGFDGRSGTRLKALLLIFCLEVFATAATAEQFTIRCPFQGFFHVTFDTDTGKVVYEGPSGSPLKGRIDSAVSDSIRFHLVRVATKDFDVVWDASKQTMTWFGVPGDRARQEASYKCGKTDLRSSLSMYDDIAPY
jgi:hypothetical protein